MTSTDITEEEFQAWRESPITRWVMEGVQAYADLQRQYWADASWRTRTADQALLTELSIRADAYEGLANLNYEQATGLHETVEST